MSLLSYLLAVSPLVFVQVEDELLSETFLSRSAILQLLLMTALLAGRFRSTSTESLLSGQLKKMTYVLAQSRAQGHLSFLSAVYLQRDVLTHRILGRACAIFVSGEENKKMAPISLKDPNIQALAEELVKELTSFKVIGIFFTTV